MKKAEHGEHRTAVRDLRPGVVKPEEEATVRGGPKIGGGGRRIRPGRQSASRADVGVAGAQGGTAGVPA